MGLNPTWEEWADQELILDERASAFIRYVKNFVMQGFGLADGGGLNLTVGIGGLNFAYINGYEIRQTGIVVKVLTDGALNHVFLKFVKTPDIIAGTAAIAISIEVNTTGIPPANSMKLGTATTAGGVITLITQENLKLEIHDAKLGTDLDADGKQFKNVGVPVAGTDVVRLVDLLEKLGDLSWKDSARAATTADIVLSGLPIIDTVSLVAGDRVLVKDQTLPEENGIYVAAAGAWSRADDCNTAAELEAAAVLVEEGAQAGSMWRQTSTNFVLGVGAVVWVQMALTLTYGNAADLQDVTDGAESAGVSTNVARADHQHFHGNLGGGALHAVVTPSVPGFMSAADKTALDQLFTENTLTTVDALFHTIATIPVTADAAVLVEAHIIGKQASGARAGYVMRALVYRTGVGAATMQGTDQTDINRESNAGMDAQISVSGTDAIVEIKGLAVTTVKWKCQHRSLEQVG